MKAEILSIGTEILLGEIVDTNAQYIASRLPGLGGRRLLQGGRRLAAPGHRAAGPVDSPSAWGDTRSDVFH